MFMIGSRFKVVAKKSRERRIFPKNDAGTVLNGVHPSRIRSWAPRPCCCSVLRPYSRFPKDYRRFLRTEKQLNTQRLGRQRPGLCSLSSSANVSGGFPPLPTHLRQLPSGSLRKICTTTHTLNTASSDHNNEKTSDLSCYRHDALRTDPRRHVGLYGSLDYGLLYDRTELGGDSGLVQRSNALRLDSGLTNRSYVGLIGEEDLNAEWRVRFRLEGGFSGDSGELDDGGRLFSRESTLTVSGPYGDLSVGRTGTLSSSVGTYGLFGNYAQPFGETSQVLEAADWSFGSYAADNMITYASPSVGGVRAYAQYSFGFKDDAARTRNKTRYLSAGLTLDRGPVSAMAAAERWLNPHFDSETGGKLPGVSDGTVLMIGGSYDLGVVRPYFSYEHSWDAPYALPLGETDLTTNSVYAVTGYRLSAGFSAPFGNHTFKALAHYNSFEFDVAGLNRLGETDRSLTY